MGEGRIVLVFVLVFGIYTLLDTPEFYQSAHNVYNADASGSMASTNSSNQPVLHDVQTVVKATTNVTDKTSTNVTDIVKNLLSDVERIKQNLKTNVQPNTKSNYGKKNFARFNSTAGAPYENFEAIPCRDDFARIAQTKLNKLGRAAEVGVYRCEFTEKNLRHWKGEYHAIDAWSHRPKDGPDRNEPDQSIHDQSYNTCKQKVRFAGDRVQLHKNLSVPGATMFPDEHFDWIYVDALHTYKAVHEDLEAWYPKLRSGGMMSGDDYGDVASSELMTLDRWTKKFKVAWNPKVKWGVITGVRDFANKKGLMYHVTWHNDCYPWAAWYLFKP